MKVVVLGLVLALLTGCSSVSVSYTHDGVHESFEVCTQGDHHIVVHKDHTITVTTI